MLDIGWSELLVIGVVALIVVGPKDLPILFRRMGEFTGKARAMAREFSSAMDKAADEAGVKDVQKDLRNIANPRKMGLDAINDAARDMSNWDKDDAASVARTAKPAPAGAKSSGGAATAATETKPAAAAVREAAEEAGSTDAPKNEKTA